MFNIPGRQSKKHSARKAKMMTVRSDLTLGRALISQKEACSLQGSKDR